MLTVTIIALFSLFSNTRRLGQLCVFTFTYNDVLRLFISAVVIVLNNTVMELNLIIMPLQ